jgi:8-oxo-dGTP pyrophosphatase MutT (NUDIX family)
MAERPRLPCLIVDSSREQVWTAAYVPTLSELLGVDAEELGRLNLHRGATGAVVITPADLERLVDSPYVIIDTSGDSAAAYLLLGYALANRKPVIHVHDNRSAPIVAVPGVRPRIYDSPASLISYLTQVAGYYQFRHDSPEAPQLKDFLARCGFPLTVLEGDGRYQYALPVRAGERPIYVTLSAERFVPPEPWRSEFNLVLQRQQDYAESTGAVLFNGDLVRLRDYTPLRDERLGVRGIRLDGQRTDYFTFASSNHCWDYVSAELAEKLRATESRVMSDLRGSLLANPLSVAVSLVIRDLRNEWLLIQRRNREKNFHGKQDFICAAAGMVSASRDVRSEEIDVYATACNELREETGLRVREEQVVFLALLRETTMREVGLVAEVEIEGSPARILGPRADNFESKGFMLCEATPEAFAAFIRQHGPIERFAPMGAGAILFSLLRRFSSERIEAAFGS